MCLPFVTFIVTKSVHRLFYSRLSLNGHLFKTGSSVKTDTWSWFQPFSLPLFHYKTEITVRRTLSAGPLSEYPAGGGTSL